MYLLMPLLIPISLFFFYSLSLSLAVSLSHCRRRSDNVTWKNFAVQKRCKFLYPIMHTTFAASLDPISYNFM